MEGSELKIAKKIPTKDPVATPEQKAATAKWLPLYKASDKHKKLLKETRGLNGRDVLQQAMKPQNPPKLGRDSYEGMKREGSSEWFIEPYDPSASEAQGIGKRVQNAKRQQVIATLQNWAGKN